MPYSIETHSRNLAIKIIFYCRKFKMLENISHNITCVNIENQYTKYPSKLETITKKYKNIYIQSKAHTKRNTSPTPTITKESHKLMLKSHERHIYSTQISHTIQSQITYISLPLSHYQSCMRNRKYNQKKRK